MREGEGSVQTAACVFKLLQEMDMAVNVMAALNANVLIRERDGLCRREITS